MRVVWTTHARNRLGDIYAYIADASPERADRVSDRLLDATDQLAEHPLSGPLLPEDGAYRQLTVDGYRIAYRATARSVYVMTIVAPGMLYDQTL